MTEQKIFYDCNKLNIKNGEQKPQLDIILDNGKKHYSLEPRMFFPVCKKDRIISLNEIDVITGIEKTILILKNIGDLNEPSRIALNSALDFYYLIPVIESIEKATAIRGNLHWSVVTNKGNYEIDIVAPMRNIRMEADGTIYVRDLRDNRYEIKNLPKLPKKTQREVVKYL